MSTAPRSTAAVGSRASASVHLPVLVDETMAALRPMASGALLDGTVGLGGHALAWLKETTRAGETGRVLGLDRDGGALAVAVGRLEAQFPGRATLRQASYERAADVCASTGYCPDAALLDLGASSMQLDDAARGFSFQAAGPLDMRMDGGDTGAAASGALDEQVDEQVDERDLSDSSAADLVNTSSADELEHIFLEFGEEPAARRIAAAIVADRRAAPFRDTLRLAETIARATGGRRGRLHPATRVFQALRIAVNDELGRLERGLPAVLATLDVGGRFGVISFHRLEDRICKRFLDDAATRGDVELLADGLPSRQELSRNPRSRSARLRAAKVLRRREAS